MQKDQAKQKYHGYVALTAVITVSLVALTTVVGLLLVNTTGLKAYTIKQDYYKTYYLAESCTERAIDELQSDISFDGSIIINDGDKSCEVVDITGSGNNNRTIQVVSNGISSTVRLEIIVEEIRPDVIIGGWSEVESF